MAGGDDADYSVVMHSSRSEGVASYVGPTEEDDAAAVKGDGDGDADGDGKGEDDGAEDASGVDSALAEDDDAEDTSAISSAHYDDDADSGVTVTEDE